MQDLKQSRLDPAEAKERILGLKQLHPDTAKIPDHQIQKMAQSPSRDYNRQILEALKATLPK